eukprot:CAMPEP_0169063082 /NCGR_PEP_ID=MMETSP1015-20121227/1073_1 /TAXON_ID=342587 /ORGANISM="Karlodinium micrum, Strain CCMP2283" /LENGTH=152 /DNA_ID=CAMNT_0009121351 /DNA_START=40 /DNA_END=498 /DNA_ORIENTATION=-
MARLFACLVFVVRCCTVHAATLLQIDSEGLVKSSADLRARKTSGGAKDAVAKSIASTFLTGMDPEACAAGGHDCDAAIQIMMDNSEASSMDAIHQSHHDFLCGKGKTCMMSKSTACKRWLDTVKIGCVDNYSTAVSVNAVVVMIGLIVASVG